MEFPSEKNLVLRLWGITLILLLGFSLLKQELNIRLNAGGEIVWLFISPAILRSIYKRKYKQPISEETAEKVSNYFIISIIVFSIISGSIYLANNWSAKLAEHIVTLAIALIVYFGFIAFFGRWIVSAVLTNYGRDENKEP